MPHRANGAGCAFKRLAVTEWALAHDATINRDERVSTLQDPRVHDLTNGLARGFFNGVPQVGGHRVGIGVALEVEANAISKRGFAKVLLQHPQDRAALFVGQDVEHAVGIFGGVDFILNGSSGVESVNGQGHFLFQPKTGPALPRGLECVSAQHFHEGGERFVQPNAFPPTHGDEVTEPHVGNFVGNNINNALQVDSAGVVWVDEQCRLAERHATEVLHGAKGEVRDSNEVELVARVGNVEVLGEESQGKGTNVE